LDMLAGVREAMPSPGMQRVFGEMCDSLAESYRLEETIRAKEAELM
jgi:hypothetical protein